MASSGAEMHQLLEAKHGICLLGTKNEAGASYTALPIGSFRSGSGQKADGAPTASARSRHGSDTSRSRSSTAEGGVREAKEAEAGEGGWSSLFSRILYGDGAEAEVDVDALLRNPKLEDTRAGIDGLRREVEGDILREYADEFEHAVASEEIVVGLVPEEVLAQREAEIELARLREEEEQARKFAQREARLAAKEDAARARIIEEKADLADRIRRREAQTVEAAEARTSALHRVFRRAEVALKSSLAAQHAVVSEKYGRIVPGRAGARLLRIEWHKLPQPVEFRIHKLRAVKNKLPSGRYVMLVTLYDRLGGNPLRWTKMPLSGGGGDVSRPGATTPVRHRGRFYDTEVLFNQCVYAVAPSQVDLRPSHVFVFELFLLGGRTNPIDRVVAWTAMPACDRDFQVVWGRFKLPLLRGEVDLAIDKYRGIETTFSKDLDNWLANMYIEVVHLPRETTKDGVTTREFDVEVAYTSELLRIRGEHRLPKRWAEGAPASPPPGMRKRKGVGNKTADADAAAAALEEAAAAAAAEAEEETSSDSDSELSDDDDDGDESSSSAGASNDDWESDGGREEDDFYAGGPQVVADDATREDIVALGPVDAAPSAGGGASPQNRRASKLRAAAISSAFVRRARDLASSSEGARSPVKSGPRGSAEDTPHVPARPASRAVAARAAAEYWRARAAAGTTAIGSGAGAMPADPAGGGTGLDAPDDDDEHTPLAPATVRAVDAFLGRRAVPGSARQLAAGVSTRGGGLGAVAGAARGRMASQRGLAPPRMGANDATSAVIASRVGSAFAAEAARGRNLLNRAAAALQTRAADVLNVRLGLARKPQAGALTSTAVHAALPGHGNVAERGRALGAGSGLASFTYAVNKQEGKGLRGARVRESVRKLRFLQHEVVADLHPGGILTFEFWIQFVIMLVALWLRIYIHYLGQYLFLRSLRVPVYELRPLAYSATLKYVPDVLPNEVEIGVVLLGPISVTTIFGVFMAISWLSQRILGYFPEVPSRFVAFFGVGSVLDSLLIVLIDAMAGRYDCVGRYEACRINIAAPECQCSEGDAFKLYRRFVKEEGSGVVGIVLTVFIYLVLALLAMFFQYLYMLHLHLNGRMIDLFRRLHAEDSKFMLPNDFEVSPNDLQWIVSRAARWRGPRGSTRKVAVCDYVLTDPLDPTFKETTTHLIIYHATLDGKRELYRHFLRMPDGAILEVFGSMERTLGVASGLGTSALQDLLMTHGKHDDDAGMHAFFDGL